MYYNKPVTLIHFKQVHIFPRCFGPLYKKKNPMSASIKYSDTLERFISVNVSTNPLKISNTEKLLLYMRDKKKKKKTGKRHKAKCHLQIGGIICDRYPVRILIGIKAILTDVCGFHRYFKASNGIIQ